MLQYLDRPGHGVLWSCVIVPMSPAKEKFGIVHCIAPGQVWCAIALWPWKPTGSLYDKRLPDGRRPFAV